MKKILFLLLTILMVTTNAYGIAGYFWVNGLRYWIDSDRSDTKVNGFGDIINVVVPEAISYEGRTYIVTTVGSETHLHSTMVESVILPNTVNKIERGAFFGCESLTSIILPEGVDIGVGAFSSCIGLSSITIPKGVKIGRNAFQECKGLSSIILSEGVTEIKGQAFKGCSELTSIKIPNNFDSFGDSIFMNCEKLKDVKLPNNLKTISKSAFEGCTSLESIDIPNTVKKIDRLAFAYCSKLSSFDLKSVAEIERHAFAYCSSLLHIDIPESVEILYRDAFANSGLESVAIHAMPTFPISGCPFEKCNNLQTAVFDCPVIEPGWYFYETGLRELYFNEGVTEIGLQAFQVCPDLEIVHFGNTITTIGERAFFGCEKLSTLDFSNASSLTTIGKMSFNGTNVKTLTLPNSLKVIGYEAFRQCYELVSVKMPNTVLEVGNGAFWMCRKLETFNLSNSLQSIGRYAFAEDGFTSITIPRTVKFIGAHALEDCKEMKKIVALMPTPWECDGSPTAQNVEILDVLLYVPKGTKDKYKTFIGLNWRKFNSNNIVELPEGDLTGDNKVNGMDLILLVNDILDQQPDAAEYSDINGDGRVNGMDYVALVNIILESAFSSRSSDVAAARGGGQAHNNIIDVEPLSIAAGESRELVVTLKNPGMAVTMAQMDVTLPKGLTLSSDYTLERTDKSRHQLFTGGSGQQRRLILASGTNATLAGDEGCVMRLTLTADETFVGGDIVFSDILCASPELQAAEQPSFVLQLGETTSIDGNMSETTNNDVPVYDLQGRRVADNKANPYKKGDNGKKVIIK